MMLGKGRGFPREAAVSQNLKERFLTNGWRCSSEQLCDHVTTSREPWQPVLGQTRGKLIWSQDALSMKGGKDGLLMGR